MMYRSMAPLRIGLAGGGTDTAPYSDIYGGAILNATISLYAYATIQPRSDDRIVLRAVDRDEVISCDSSEILQTDGLLPLHKGVYNRIVKDFAHHKLSFELTTHVDAPAGSGMGTSSTLVVAMVGAFAEWLKIPLGEYETAHLAYQIERDDLAMAGGKQDQYSATFGGFNFMEFYEDRVIVNPLRIKPEYLSELEFDLLLYNTGTSRLSHKIIETQTASIRSKEKQSLEAMHQLKQQAVKMKEAILTGQHSVIGDILDFGWKYKKQLSPDISNTEIDRIYDAAIQAGAQGGKISGAGGGGHMFFYCPRNTRYEVAKAVGAFGGEVVKYHFVSEGLRTWKQRL
jgi:D-glycero-alpha-D-manno-heptose-7-phosphate kinase